MQASKRELVSGKGTLRQLLYNSGRQQPSIHPANKQASKKEQAEASETPPW